LALAACSSAPTRPVIYPDAHYQSVGRVGADQDIDRCMALARDSGIAETRDGEIPRKAGRGAAVGGVAAGAWGLVSGNAAERALAGAAAGAGAGVVKGAFDSTETSPVFRNFVQRCLSNQGYHVIGWQ
jgi:hypothetical protein